MADSEFLVIVGPYEARVNPSSTGGVPWSEWFTAPGRYTMTTRTERVEVKKKPIPPPPAPLPEIPVPEEGATPTPPITPPEETTPTLPPGTPGEWAKKKAPTHRDLYHKLAGTMVYWIGPKAPTHRELYDLINTLQTQS